MFIVDGIVPRKAGLRIKALLKEKLKPDKYLVDFCHEHGFDYQTFGQWLSFGRQAREHAADYTKAILELLGLTAGELDEIAKKAQDGAGN